jgi:ABC-type nitrate/sulfonate/bicarbonate transport system permease component
MYRESKDNGYLVTALVDRETYQTYEITEQPSYLRSTTFRAAVGAVAAAAIGIILGSRAGRSSSSLT